MCRTIKRVFNGFISGLLMLETQFPLRIKLIVIVKETCIVVLVFHTIKPFFTYKKLIKSRHLVNISIRLITWEKCKLQKSLIKTCNSIFLDTAFSFYVTIYPSQFPSISFDGCLRAWVCNMEKDADFHVNSWINIQFGMDDGNSIFIKFVVYC